MSKRSLEEWLTYINALYEKKINLGLSRPLEVARRLDLLNPKASVITIAGTNGKGSTVAALEAIYLAQGFKVATFTSPYFHRFNELIRLQGIEVTNDQIIDAFEKIESSREQIVLTPFEYNTLAALEIFKQASVDIYLLEIGLGGRLDAVNIIDADLAIVTSIDLDHQDWLGETRELISVEKAGIFRPHKPAIYGDTKPPKPLVDYAKELDVTVYFHGQDFNWTEQKDYWTWQSQHVVYDKLPLPSLALQNIANAIMAIEVMQPVLPVEKTAIERGLSTVYLAGRLEMIPGSVVQVFDVSHNPAGANWLAKKLKSLKPSGKTRAVFSMLADKDIHNTISQLKDSIDEWHIAELHVDRGAKLTDLQTAFRLQSLYATSYAQVKEAYEAVMRLSQPGDQVVVFGSFYTVNQCKIS
jgi:dihydrofolate synthase/folylpolyglutamate synthase